MARGDVWVADVELPDQSNPGSTTMRKKHVVELRRQAGRCAVVLASTDRRQGKPTRPFEVRFGEADGSDRDAVIDGRWVYTIPEERLIGAQHVRTFDEQMMERVAEAIAVGLDLL
ncbi:type II toxin-antitoxin system PemK/MazF family toxin [Actinomarinicola tropica]|nr:type II toxin-antitoxin system PemK/MazF family toxin [Actinomarinicola tropica]